MSLPILGHEDLYPETMQGVITGKTAELMQRDGEAWADRIEKRSQQFEAQTKGPGIAELYGEAYTRVANGDFTGFGFMQKARGLAAGNPLLMKMVEDGDAIAGKLANAAIDAKTQTASQAGEMKREEYVQGRKL